MPPESLFNRWIVPLDRGIDLLKLPDGDALEIPFDCFIIFSTNLVPTDLADEAILRRLPYKLHVPSPTFDGLTTLLRREASKANLQLPSATVDLLRAFYQRVGVEVRGCHARDLIQLAKARQRYLKNEPIVDEASLKDVLKSYFYEVSS